MAPDNLIDVFDDAERRQVLADMKDLLAPEGLFIFSTHDLGWLDSNSGPREWEVTSTRDELRKLIEKSPVELVKGVRSRRERKSNRKRLGPFQQRNGDHAIINDFPHDYSLLHYYIRRDDQERQLEELGYELVECPGPTGAPSVRAAPAHRTLCTTPRAPDVWADPIVSEPKTVPVPRAERRRIERRQAALHNLPARLSGWRSPPVAPSACHRAVTCDMQNRASRPDRPHCARFFMSQMQNRTR